VFEIARSQVIEVKTVDITSGERRTPTLAESRQYVTDTSGGVTADILRDLEEQFRGYTYEDGPITAEKIKEFWEGRLESRVTITNRGVRKTKRSVATWRQASYGSGSWLRGGSAQITVPTDGGGRGGARGGGGAGRGLETDPERWWAGLRPETRLSILRAFAGEALCESEVMETKCRNCGGRGGRPVVTSGAGGGSDGVRTCPFCRGTGRIVKLRYR
jgi:hypothetical protein